MEHLFFGWLRAKALTAAAVLCSNALIIAVFLLYGLPTEPFWYAFALSAVLWLLAGLCSFLACCRKRQRLRLLEEEILRTAENLPQATDPIENAYLKLVRQMSEELQRVNTRHRNELTQQQEYYTLWAHQIKTPIAAMYLLLQTRTDESAVELEIELQKLEQYVQMVLQYLRLDGSVMDLTIQSVDLDCVIRQCVKKFARQFIRKKLRLVYNSTQLTVLTDEKWLSFVIEQLLSNALKYTKQGAITLRFEPDDILAIEDTGIGIAPEDLPRVCERSFTGYNGRQDKKSTGIGLYLCKRVLALLGHTLDIRSTPGKGTCVRIGLKRTPVEIE